MSDVQKEDKETREGQDVCEQPNSTEAHDAKSGQLTKEVQEPKAARDPKETLERRSSKSRLSKQDEIEEVEEEHDHSPSSEASDATIVPTGVDTPVVRTPGGSPESNSPEEDGKLESQRSVDSDKNSPTQGNNPKAKLLRSKAVCDDTSPPPEDTTHATVANTSQTNASSTTNLSASNSASVSPVPTTMATLTVSPTPHRHQKLEKDSSQGSMSDNSNSPMLSRDSSMDKYTDSTGIDLESFIKMTLNKNRNDRNTLLDLENKLTKFIKESKQQYFKFPQMSSYHRMLVHRVAAFFGLDHNVDQSGKCVVVNRTNSTRIPDFKFADHISDEMSDDKPKTLLRREDKCGSFDETRSPEKVQLGIKSKSLEERKDNYDKVKMRIFKDSSGNFQDANVHEGTTSQSSIQKSSLSSSKDETHWSRWSSADSSGYSTDNSQRAQKITKASSLPSYFIPNESRTSSMSSNTRLSKTDSLSSGTSGLSSPMARPVTIQSSPPSEQLSESSGSNQSATSPAQLHAQTGDAQSPGPLVSAFYDDKGQPMTIWVATAPHMIPPGSIIINKQTCQPYLNSDGTPYRWNPSHQSQMANMMQGQSSQYPGPNQAQQLLPAQQADAYATVHYNGQQRGQQQQLAPPAVHHIQQDSATNSELTQRVASMTLSPQHSTESLPPDSSCGMPAPQPAIIGNVPQGNMAQPQPPQPAPPQPHGYSHMPQQQVPYFVPNTSTCNPQIRIMYQPAMPFQRPSSQGQMEIQGQGQVLAQAPGQAQGQLPAAAPATANGQYAVPQSAYQSPFSQLTVHSVETFQQQQQQVYQQHMMAQPNYAGEVTAPQQQPPQQQQQQQQQQPQQQPQQQQAASLVQPAELAGGQLNYSQYVGQGGAETGLPQGAYLSMQGCVPPNSASASSTHIVAFQGGQAQGHFPGGQVAAAYRPKSPPGQGPVASLAAQGPNAVAVMPSLPLNAPQYVSFTYPGQQQQQQQQQGPGVPSGVSHPQQSAPQSVGIGPRHQAAQIWNSLPQGMAGSQPPTQGYPLMRPPAVQIGDSRFMGQPLHQVPRPQIQPLFTPGRPRVPTPTGVPGQCGGNQTGVMVTKGGKGRKSWAKGGRESALSPQSSVESTESSEELSGSSTLEVSGLPTHLTKEELDVHLGDLIKLGARIHVIGDEEGGGGGSAAAGASAKAIGEMTVVAVFESEHSAMKAQSLQKHNQFKLRPMCARGYESSDLATISEHAS